MKSNCACRLRLLLFLIFSGVFMSSTGYAQTAGLSAVNVRLVTDEAEAVLAILAKRKTNAPVTEADWQEVFLSEGYIRLKKREASMKRAFEDANFKAFVLADQTAERAPALADTLAKWKRADVSGAARLALAYLPKEAHITAKVSP